MCKGASSVSCILFSLVVGTFALIGIAVVIFDWW